jgi:peptide/nickel transport system substrate-binding protein
VATAGDTAAYNSAIQAELYVPLTFYDSTSGKLAFDQRASAASSIVYSNGDKTVTITLAKLNWSDGTPVTSRDVQFFFNLVKANKTLWANYVQGQFPDNVRTFSIINNRTFRLDLTSVVNPQWFSGNELSMVTPLPQQVWDIKSTGGKVGNYDETTSGAKAVFKYLNGQNSNLSTFGSNPLWKTTDGPFTLGAWTTGGAVTLNKSKTYDGTDAAHLNSVQLLPFASGTAEFNVLRSGNLDYGYIPASDLSQTGYLKSRGYEIKPWNGWAINYSPYNFNNPVLGATFKQLYVRQAIQMAIDQPAIAKLVWHHEATPVYGPVPQTPASAYLSTVQKDNPYPFNATKAKKLLEDHGWKLNSNGVMACSSPGSAATECGAGVKAGTVLDLHMLSESGSTETTNQMEVMTTELAKIGVGFQASYAPLNLVLSETAQCKPTQASCKWQLSYFGTQGSWYFSPSPNGDPLFASTGSANFGNYDNATANALAVQATSSSNPSALRNWSAYLAQQLPALWLPVPAYQVSAIKTTLKGVSQDPLAGQTMQRWHLTK